MNHLERKQSMHKYIALLLVFVFIVGLMPFSAFATDTGEESESAAVWQAEDTEEYVPGEYIVQYEEPNAAEASISLFSTEASDTEQPVQMNEVLEEYDAAVTDAAVAGTLRVTAETPLEAEDEAAFMEELQNTPGVVSVEKNRVVEICTTEASGVYEDTYAEDQWGLTNIRAYDAWAMMPETTTTVRVAVVDTGVDASHPDLAGRILDGYTAIDYNSKGQKYDPNQADDDHGHGTHVSGIIAAVCDNQLGIQGVAGMANVEILPVKVLNEAGKGDTYSIIEGIRYAADNGADIINLSLGSNYPSEAEREAIVYAQNKGCLIIAASGNESVDVATTYPASYDNVISVGSVDKDDARSYFSNYGETLDICAPGSSIISTVPKSAAMEAQLEGTPVYGNDVDGYYVAWSGTSMATPHVSAVAALYKAANPTASNWDIGDHLIRTARDVGPIGKDIETGAGVVDAAAVMGEDIVQTAILLLEPSAGKELYQDVTLKVQVNPSMNIDHVNFYLNTTDGAPVASISCNGADSYYSTEWDTTAVPDGMYDFIAIACDASGVPVGEPCQTSVTVLNNITDGFTLQVLDPSDTSAGMADITIYGVSADGTYENLRTTYTSDLGFARVKGLDTNYQSYMLVFSGSWQEQADGPESYFVYQRQIGKEMLGQMLTIGKEDARSVSFTLLGADGSAVDSPYLVLGTTYDKNGETVDADTLEALQIQSGTKLYLDDGVYRTYGYWSPGAESADGNAYYLTGMETVDSGSTAFVLRAADGTKVTPAFNTNVTGVLTLTEVTGESSIPLVSGKISGGSIYITPGTYHASADIQAEYEGKTWNLSLSKKTPVTVTDTPVTVNFGTDLSLEKFEDNNSLRTDGQTAYLYRGESLRTVNQLGDGLADSDNEISNITSGYPTLNVYQVDGDVRTLIYTRQDIWQLSGSQWNSGQDYIDSVPQAGQYVAELVFDAGPFGGVSRKSISFELRNRSGAEEMDMAITMNGHVFPYASIAFYYWDETAGQWKDGRAGADELLADGEGIVRNVVVDDIKLNPNGINLALVSYSQRKLGYNPADTYVGFQVVPFESLSELSVINLEEGTQMNMEVLDGYGNKKSLQVYLPVMSDGGGRLATESFVTDIPLNITAAYGGGTVYIPKGTYAYAYSMFHDGATDYCVTVGAFDTDATEKLVLDGRTTVELTVELPAGWSGYRLYPTLGSGAEPVHGLTFNNGNVFRLSEGTYQPKVSMEKDGYLRTVTADTAMVLERDQTWKIGATFTPQVQLKQDQVAANQTLIGNVSFKDDQGNTLTDMAKKSGLTYVSYMPELAVGCAGQAEKTAQTTYSGFAVAPESYSGQGAHYLIIRYDTGDGPAESAKIPFTVGALAHIIQPVTSNLYTCSEQSDTSVLLTVAQNAKGYKTIYMDVLPSTAERTIVIEVLRNGKCMTTFETTKLFTESNHTLSVGLNIKPGDQIAVEAR
jgi:subtilisin family serine protease